MKPSSAEILDEIARAHIPDNFDLFPRLVEQVSREKQAPLRRIWRYHPVAAVLLALLILAALAGVAYALGNVLGYIPGVGVIQQDATLRILEQPVSLTRQGITLTVHQAVLSSDKSVVLFSVEGVPWEALSPEENIPGCSGQAFLRLPSGESMQLISGGGSPHASRFVYAPISPDIDEITFVMPCLLGTLPGKAPENWELTLRFVAAPPDIAIAEVIDVPTPTPPQLDSTAIPSVEASAQPEAIPSPAPFQLHRVVEYSDGYIFLLTFTNVHLLDGGMLTAFMSTVEITDARGQAQFAVFANDIDFSDVPEEVDMVWAYRLSAGDIAWPLRFTVQSDRLDSVPSQATFTFDTGPNPQKGQEWELDDQVIIDGIPVRLDSATFTGHGYDFTFTTQPQVESIAIEIPGTQPMGGGGGGDGQGMVHASLEYQGTPPVGEITLAVTELILRSPGPVYTVTWSPEDATTDAEELSPFGIELALERSIPLEDGYYLAGALKWEDTRLSEVASSAWNMQLQDAQGENVPFEPAHADELGLSETTPAQWVGRVYGRPLRAPLTLKMNQVEITFAQPVSFTIDLASMGFNAAPQQLGNSWKIGLLPIELPAYIVQVRSLRFVRQGDLQGFELTWEAPPAIQAIHVTLDSGVIGGQGRGGGGSGRDAEGVLRSYVLTDGELTGLFTFAVHQISLKGAWQATWAPPDADPNAPPPSQLQACASSAAWLATLAQPPALPAGVGGKVIVYGHLGERDYSSTLEDFGAFIADLDGSHRQALPPGAWYALSPQVSSVAYSTDDGLHLFDLTSGIDRFLAATQPGDYAPLWSPDGGSLAFIRSAQADIYILHLYTDSLQQVTSHGEYEGLVGWEPDGTGIYFTLPADKRVTLMFKDLLTGIEHSLFSFDSTRGGEAAISPDGTRVAYLERVPGELAAGLFVSLMDHSQRQLILQLGELFLSNPLWSGEGDWILVTVHPPYIFLPRQIPALINPQTCELVPLPRFNGQVFSWVNP